MTQRELEVCLVLFNFHIQHVVSLILDNGLFDIGTDSQDAFLERGLS